MNYNFTENRHIWILGRSVVRKDWDSGVLLRREVEQSEFLWGLKFQGWRSSMQGVCEPVATFPLILGAGKETRWQEKLVPVFVLNIGGQSWKIIWKILKCAEMFCPYKEACL